MNLAPTILQEPEAPQGTRPFLAVPFGNHVYRFECDVEAAMMESMKSIQAEDVEDAEIALQRVGEPSRPFADLLAELAAE